MALTSACGRAVVPSSSSVTAGAWPVDVPPADVCGEGAVIVGVPFANRLSGAGAVIVTLGPSPAAGRPAFAPQNRTRRSDPSGGAPSQPRVIVPARAKPWPRGAPWILRTSCARSPVLAAAGASFTATPSSVNPARETRVPAWTARALTNSSSTSSAWRLG